jgi:ketosteroid isomerase-like protein
MSHRPKRRAGSRAVTRVIAGITAPLLVLITAAEAHDFWPVPDAVQVAEGNALEVRGPTARSASTTGHSQASDSAAAVAVVRRFNELLSVGDSLAALALLTEDAIVLESGSTETRAEYRSHHLPADIEFARAVRSQRTVRHASVRGDVAWVSSTSTAQGEFRARPVNSVGAELMVLVRTPTGWKISAIHWSSRSRRS